MFAIVQLAVGISLAVAAFFMGRSIGTFDVRQQAVIRGHGQWVTTEKGTIFEWR